MAHRVANRPDGPKILDMLNERERLMAKLKSNLPLYEYLSERREWWRIYPDYKKTVEDDFKGSLDRMAPR